MTMITRTGSDTGTESAAATAAMRPAAAHGESARMTPQARARAMTGRGPVPAIAARLPGRVPARVRMPVRWIHIDGVPRIPVVDKVSDCLYEAWEALAAGEFNRAACRMRAASDELKSLAVMAAHGDGDSGVSQRRHAQITSWRLASGALRTGLAAARLDKGRIQARADLLAILDAGSWADIDRRWLYADEATWYPVAGEVRRHLAAANVALGTGDREAGCAEIHKASAYLRLEEARADGYARRALGGALDDLASLAATAQAGDRPCAQVLEGRFAGVLFALALAHRNRAAEAWVRREYAKAGYAFLAAGEILGNALEWGRDCLKPGPSAAALECAALGQRFLAGGHPDRSDVLHVVQSFVGAADLLETVGPARRTEARSSLPWSLQPGVFE